MSRPFTGTRCWRCQPSSSACHCCWTFPGSYSEPRYFTALRSSTATPMRTLVGVTPRTAPAEPADPLPPEPLAPAPEPDAEPPAAVPPVPPPPAAAEAPPAAAPAGAPVVPAAPVAAPLLPPPFTSDLPPAPADTPSVTVTVCCRRGIA